MKTKRSSRSKSDLRKEVVRLERSIKMLKKLLRSR